MEDDLEDKCFICAEKCTDSAFFLIHLTSKKNKTKYLTLIGDLINKEYELRVCERNKVCERCCVLLEKYDELQQETKTVKSVLSRQIASSYNIETNEEQIFMDNSKTFIKLNPSANNISDIKYSCKMCKFVTTGHNVDVINAHCLYHKIQTDYKIQANEIIKDLTPSIRRNNRNQPIGRENRNQPEFTKKVIQVQKTKSILSNTETKTECEDESYFQIPNIIIEQQEYDEETLENAIDLNLILGEENSEISNLKNNKCMMSSCGEKFEFVADYVKHLKLNHKSCTINHIFSIVRANIKRPKKHSKMMCPYCFSLCHNSELLEEHVRLHETGNKPQIFTERIHDFVSNLIKLSDVTEEVCKNNSMNVQCKYCTQLFCEDKKYHNHLALEHGRCFICLSSVEDKTLLRDHIVAHSK